VTAVRAPSLLAGSLDEFRRDRLGLFRRLSREGGAYAPLRIRRTQVLFLNDPELIGQVLGVRRDHFSKDYLRPLFNPLVRGSIEIADSDSWLHERKLAMPAFHARRLESYGTDMVDLTERMLAGWRPGEARDISADMSGLTLEIVAKTLYGIDASRYRGDARDAIAIVMEDFADRAGSLLALPVIIPNLRTLRFVRALYRLNKELNRMIRERRAAGAEGPDLFEMLIRAKDEHGRPMSDRQVRDVSIAIFFAGHETTATLLSWTWHLLASHPDVEARLVEEFESVLGDNRPTYADMSRLPFAEMVLAEALRLYPPAYGFGRLCLRECQLEGLRVPAGAVTLMSPWAMHRDPRFYDDPDAFLPDRWADGLAKRLPRYAYFPFGGGPRMCLGSNFATLEATLVLATVLRKFRLRSLPGWRVEPQPSITLRPKGGLRMSVESGEAVRKSPALA